MSGHRDPWPEYCRRLNKHYRQGNLRILAGAGLSIDSGFPSWGELNRGLLRKYIEEDLGRDPKTQLIVREHLDELVGELYETIGREAAADFVWNSSTRENFLEDLKQLLYAGRELKDLPLTQVHQQLAAMDRVAIFTTNFDPLLELARYRAQGGTAKDPDVAPFRSAYAPAVGTEPEPGKVYHVHGWIDPDGICGGSFVLTESQYFELFSRQGQRPNQILEYALTSGGALLILGMSLADVNLRRHLYLRARNRVSDSTEIYAVVRVHEHRLLDTYQTLHWASRGVRLVYVDRYDTVPKILREVKFGIPDQPDAPLPWMTQTLDWVRKHLSSEVVFSDKWQARARQALQQFLVTLREGFAIPQEEVIHASLFGQVELQEIATFSDSRHGFNAEEAREYAEQFRLRVAHGRSQGVAGVAFSEAKRFEVLNDPESANQNFTAEMREFYASRGLRNWRSLMALPILETNDRLPVLVLTLSSNRSDPFWTRFGERQAQYRKELELWADLVVREILSFSGQKREKSLTMKPE